MQWSLLPFRLSNGGDLLRKDFADLSRGQEHKAEKVGVGLELCQ